MKSIITGFIAFLFFIIIFIYGYQNSEHASEVKKQTIDLSHTDSKKYSIIKIKDNVLLNIPVISQFPELARGCEVTSLSMLLNSAGIKTDKLTLAKQIKKDATPRKIINNNIHYGHPNDGFVGDMYTYSKPGLGVYVQPIIELANKYMPGKIVNLTKSSFEDLKIPLSNGQPVWVIINTHYKELPDSYFTTWHTKKGTIRITSKEHSVLITGYDKNFIYFNDPLTGQKNKKAPIHDFQEAWVQMGSQAITYQE